MRPLCLTLFVLVLITCTTWAHAVVIDSFDSPAGPAGQTASQTGVGSTDSFASGSMLGGQRDLSLGVSAGATTTITGSVNVGNSGVYSQTQVGNDGVNGLIQWDGGDSHANINPIGLGGIDFAAGGHNAIQVDIGTTVAISLTVSVFTNNINFDYSTTSIPISAGPVSSVYIPYSSFTIGNGSGADFSNVGAIMIIVPGATDGASTTINLIQTVPEPTSLLLGGISLLGLFALASKYAKK